MKKIDIVPILISFSLFITSCTAHSNAVSSTPSFEAVGSIDASSKSSAVSSSFPSSEPSDNQMSSGSVSSAGNLSQPQNSPTPLEKSGTEKAESDEVYNNLYELTKSHRKRGTPEEQAACDYIKQKMEGYGYTVSVQEFDIYRRDMQANITDPLNLNPYHEEEPLAKGHNIISEINFDEDKKTIVFSAHYDTSTDSLGTFDNASGVVAVMEAARLIAEESLGYNVRVIFFSSEEYYFTGSRSYVDSLSEAEASNIAACFNVDLVGNEQDYDFMLYACDPDIGLVQEFKRIFENEEIQQHKGSSSDDVAFYEKGIPSLWFSTFNIYSQSPLIQCLQQETDRASVSIEALHSAAQNIVKFMKEVSVDAL